MKNTLLWGALFTLICAQAQAEASPEAAAPTPAPVEKAAEPSAPAPTEKTPPAAPEATAEPSAPAPTEKTAPAATAQPSAPAVINCDYKIDANTKNIDKTLVQSWSEKAVLQSFTFSPTTIDDQMKKLQSCFTDQGWTGFSTALQKSGNIEAIKAQKLTVSSQLDGDVQMGESKENQWKFTLPVQVVYQNDKEKVTQLLDINLTVGRKLNGDLGVTQMIAIPRPTQGATLPANKETAKPEGTSTPSESSPEKAATPATEPAATNSAEQPKTEAKPAEPAAAH